MSQDVDSTRTSVCHPISSDDLLEALTEDIAFFSANHSRHYRIRRAVPGEARIARDFEASPAQAPGDFYTTVKSVENLAGLRRRMIRLGTQFVPETASEELAHALFDIARIEITTSEIGNE